MVEGTKNTIAIDLNAIIDMEVNNDALCDMDIIAMDKEEKLYYLIRKKHLIARLQA